MAPLIFIRMFWLPCVFLLATLMPGIINCNDIHLNRNITGIVFSSYTSQWPYYCLGGGVILLALILLIIHWVDQLRIRIHDRKNVLTTKEVKNFRKGVPIYSDEYTEERVDIAYYKLPYSQQFEIDKKRLHRIGKLAYL